ELAGKRDLDVHLRHGVVRGSSIDLTPLRATTISGQIGAPLQLPDGRLLAFVVDRGQPGTTTLWWSHDRGQSWPEENHCVVYVHDERAALSQGRENVDFKQYWEDMGKWSFGHPAIRLLGDGRVLLAWYAGTPDCMSLHWARLQLHGGVSR
ncbi:MAG: sialidase family protein, partial [Singulisphaera sp.]